MNKNIWILSFMTMLLIGMVSASAPTCSWNPQPKDNSNLGTQELWEIKGANIINGFIRFGSNGAWQTMTVTGTTKATFNSKVTKGTYGTISAKTGNTTKNQVSCPDIKNIEIGSSMPILLGSISAVETKKTADAETESQGMNKTTIIILIAAAAFFMMNKRK